MVQAENVEETSKHGVLGRHQTCSKERIEVLSNSIERNFLLRQTPRLLYPEGFMEIGEIKDETVYASPRPPPKISFKDSWMKELGSEVAGGGEDSQ